MTKSVSPYLFHFAQPQEWKNDTSENYQPASYTEEQFVHLCNASQAAGVYQRFFKGHDVTLLALEHAAVQHRVRWEDLYGHGEFPHLYMPIPRRAVRELLNLTGADPNAEEKVRQFVASPE